MASQRQLGERTPPRLSSVHLHLHTHPAVIVSMCTRVFNTLFLVRANQIDITEFSNLGKAVETIPIDTPLHGGSVFQSRSIIECSMLFLVCFLV